MYSNPPVHGARIVAEVVNDGAMFDEWKAEMEMMSGRIKDVRQLLHDELAGLMPERDWGFVLSQIGMFSYTGAAAALAAAHAACRTPHAAARMFACCKLALAHRAVRRRVCPGGTFVLGAARRDAWASVRARARWRPNARKRWPPWTSGRAPRSSPRCFRTGRASACSPPRSASATCAAAAQA